MVKGFVDDFGLLYMCPEHYIQPAEVKMQFGIRQTVVVYNVLMVIRSS